MATMKSYTDLQQSKKLAEILPLESADGHWFNGFLGCTYRQEAKDLYDTTNNEYIPAWSLTALLGVLPTYLFEFDRGIDLNIYPHLNGKSWHCSYMPNCIENMKTDKFRLITSEDNPIDACYEMILKLNELNLL